MSIYSGFATRHQEESYDECLDSVLYIMQKRLIKFYRGQSADQDKFINLLSKIHSQMKNMETHKYLQPKSSATFDELISILKVKQIEDASMKVGANRQSCLQSQIASEDYRKKNNQVTYKPPVKISEKTKSPANKIMSAQNKLRAQTAVNKIRHRPPTFHKNNKKNAEGEESINKYQSTAQVKAKMNSHERLNERSIERVNISELQRKKNGVSARSRRETNKSLREDDVLNNLGTDGDSSDARELIRGYISRTKKSYLKGFNRRKQEIDNMFKNNI